MLSTMLSELNPHSRQAKDKIRGLTGKEAGRSCGHNPGSVEEREESQPEEGSFSFLEHIRVFSYL